jgi:hypothetical protein
MEHIKKFNESVNSKFYLLYVTNGLHEPNGANIEIGDLEYINNSFENHLLNIDNYNWSVEMFEVFKLPIIYGDDVLGNIPNGAVLKRIAYHPLVKDNFANIKDVLNEYTDEMHKNYVERTEKSRKKHREMIAMKRGY